MSKVWIFVKRLHLRLIYGQFMDSNGFVPVSQEVSKCSDKYESKELYKRDKLILCLTFHIKCQQDKINSTLFHIFLFVMSVNEMSSRVLFFTKIRRIYKKKQM